MQERIVDTHVHIWDLQKTAYPWLEGNTSLLNRTFSIEELEEERSLAGVTDGVLVQAANNAGDTDWMLEVAAGTKWIKGVVGWLPLLDPEKTEEWLEGRYGREIYFKGIRHLIHDEPDPFWLTQKNVVESLQIVSRRQLPYDVVGILPQHLEAALRLSQMIPSLKMVIDHLNQPPIAAKERFGRWGELMKEASGNPNVYAKISGLGTAANHPGWSVDDIQPYIEFVLDHFGTDRCFCGGDWPVSLLAGGYAATWSRYRQAIDALLDEEDRKKVYFKNAVAFYRL